jgi:ABC-type transporter Mla subunit MlaD
MNKERRAQIANAAAEFEAVMEQITGLVERLESVADDIESARDDEQEYFDNMPEGLQGGDKGQNAEQAISVLDAAADELRQFIGNLECNISFEDYE